MSSYYKLVGVFFIGVVLGFVLSQSTELGLALDNFGSNKILAEVPLEKPDVLEGVVDKIEEEKAPEVFDSQVEVKSSTQPSFQDMVLNLDFSGATIRIEADNIVVEDKEREEKVVVISDQSESFCNTSVGVPQHGGIFISEINWMGDEDSTSNEWIELKNTSQMDIDVTGWRLNNQDSDINVVLAGIIKSRDLFLLERGSDESVRGVLADFVYKGALSNSGDNLYLFDDHCNLIDQVKNSNGWVAGKKEGYKTSERVWSNLSWQDSLMKGGTPGGDNTVIFVESSQGSNKVVEEEQVVVNNEEVGGLYISEIQSGTDLGSSDEFIEIYNPTNEDIELTDWSIKKRSSSGNESSLVSSSRFQGLVIKSKSYLLLGNENGYKGSVVLDGSWASSNTIAYSNNGLVVYNSLDTKVFEVSWEEIPKNNSYENINGVWSVKETPDPQNGL